jgi:hypothetical protein
MATEFVIQCADCGCFLGKGATEGELCIRCQQRRADDPSNEASELPEWKMADESLSPPKSALDECLELSQAAMVLADHGNGYGWLRVALWSDNTSKPRCLTVSGLRAEVLRFVLAETERILPVLRALVQNLDHKGE